MEDCIFCKIVKGEIPSCKVYEDDNFRAIMDIAPANAGHVIILPKVHAANVFELDDEYASKVFVVAKKIAKALKEELGCDGVNILQNNGTAAGQTVFHFHMHVIPRYDNDTVNVKWQPQTVAIEDVAKMAERIANRL
ncbi:MAG: HIT family protein [Lachnospiraceae bacterium]|nr:HIT family protein [Lachnospiraceae bacterium]